MLSVEDALQRAGGFGRYQRGLLMASILMYQSYCFMALMPVLLLPRLRESWSMSRADEAMIDSAYFVGAFVGQFAVGTLYARRAAPLMRYPPELCDLPFTVETDLMPARRLTGAIAVAGSCGSVSR